MRRRNVTHFRQGRGQGYLLGLIVIVLTSSAPAGYAEPTNAAQLPAILHLPGDAFIAGRLGASDNPKLLRWSSPAFTQPLDFLLEAVEGVHYSTSSGPSKPEGEYSVELAGGDLLFGSLVRLDPGQIELDSPRFGRLSVRHDQVRALRRWSDSELVYLGPNGKAGWKEPLGTNDWIDQVGHPTTHVRGASLFGDLKIPPRAIVEFELSWKSRPDFTLALGVDENQTSLVRPFRFEVLSRPQAAGAMFLADARGIEPAQWEYTFTDPGPNWFDPAFKPRRWSVGRAGFGTEGTPGAIVRTEWSTDEIWLRRRFRLANPPKNIALSVHHDEDVRVWINGRLVHSTEGHRGNYTVVPLGDAANLLREGENTIAVHCRQTGGGQYIDVGILDQGAPNHADLVAVRETDQQASVAAIQQLSSSGRVHWIAYIDQQAGQMLVVSPDGARIADLSVPPSRPNPLGGVALVNHHGDVRLERLRISRWNGAAPSAAQGDKPRLVRVDGSVVYGRVTSVDTSAKQFVIASGDGETRVPAEQVASVISAPNTPEPADSSPHQVRVLYQDGTQFSGELRRVEPDAIQLASPALAGLVRLPIEGLRSLVLIKRSESPSPSDADVLTGVLEAEGLRLPGRLTDSLKKSQAGALVWRPDYAATASPLRPDLAGTITYRQPSPPTPKRPRSFRRVGLVEMVASALLGKSATPESTTLARRSLHLRNGDIIPCQVISIDERGLRFESPMADATYMPHDRIKAVELVLSQSPPSLTKDKWQRLLTLPRMQTPSPPTHLIRSKAGDFLRGRLLAMDENTLKVEVRAEVKQLPRDRVSHIIWLHADELATENAAPPSAAASPTAQPPQTESTAKVHVRQIDGNRLSFHPAQFRGTTLTGKSDLLGVCHADLTRAEQLLLGREIGKAATQLAYRDWKLTRAVDPKYIQVLAEPGPAAPTPGTSSTLVGRPAPDFELQLLDGDKFRLARTKGRVVVLDFWATWCGPCLQLMPQIDRVVREFQDQNVELIAVNLEEPANAITSTLQRHNLKVTVALDRDGLAASRYEAISIPHTVIIDQQGKIARVFVGGGPQVADQVRDALRNLLFAGTKKE